MSSPEKNPHRSRQKGMQPGEGSIQKEKGREHQLLPSLCVFFVISLYTFKGFGGRQVITSMLQFQSGYQLMRAHLEKPGAHLLL